MNPTISELFILCLTTDPLACLTGWTDIAVCVFVVLMTFIGITVCFAYYKGSAGTKPKRDAKADSEINKDNNNTGGNILPTQIAHTGTYVKTKELEVAASKSHQIQKTEEETVREVKEPWKEKLLRRYKQFVQDTYADTVIDDCFTEGILTSDERDKILTYGTPSEKNRHLLKFILRKSEGTYKVFLECLTGSDIKKLILETDVTQPLRRGNCENVMQIRRKVYRNYEYIVQNTLLEELTDDFISDCVFEIEDWENITNSNLNSSERNKQFVDTLLKSVGYGYQLLLSILKETGHKELATRIEKTEVSDELDEEIEAFIKNKGLENKRNPKEISHGRLMTWKADDETFHPIKTTQIIYNEAVTKSKVLVIGLPGSGKSANVHHIALRLKNEGHRICYVYRLKEIIDEMDKFGKEEKQVYVIDDAFGVHGVDEDKRKEWSMNKDDLDRCFKNTNIFILCTSRLQVIADEKLSFIKSKFAVVNISQDENELTSDERVEIFRKHASSRRRDELLTDHITRSISELDCPVGCFPLICRLYTGDRDTKQSIEDYFTKPLNVIADNLQQLRLEEPLRHLCLLMCLIYDNLPLDVIDVGDESKKTKKLRKELLELCELPADTPRPLIKNKMDTLLNTFLILEDDVYHFLHDIIHDAVIKHTSSLSSSVHKSILRHCSETFMLRRVHLSEMKCEGLFSHYSESCINVRKDTYSTWSERVLQLIHDGITMADELYNDISMGRCTVSDLRVAFNPWRSVFYNPCVFSTDTGDKAISAALSKKSSSDVETLMCSQGFPKAWLLGVSHRHTALHWAVFAGLKQTVSQTISSISQTKLQEVDSVDRLLCVACRKPDNIDMIHILIECGMDVNQRDIWCGTPLWRSVLNKDYKTTEWLVNNGADINLCSKYGESPLYWSQIWGDDSMTILLQNNGALCIYNGRTYNHITDIPDTEVELEGVREKIQTLRRRQILSE